MADYLDFGLNVIGLVTGYTEEKRAEIKTEFIRAEGKSRWFLEQVLWTINGDLELYHKPQLYKYDLYFYSGDTRVNAEGKVRDYPSNQYTDLKISASKCDFKDCNNWWVVTYFEGDDRWFIWDLGEYKPRFEKDGYRHRKYTALPYDPITNPIIVEDAWVFDFDRAKLSGGLYGA